jgi:hypothetical protein
MTEFVVYFTRDGKDAYFHTIDPETVALLPVRTMADPVQAVAATDGMNLGPNDLLQADLIAQMKPKILMYLVLGKDPVCDLAEVTRIEAGVDVDEDELLESDTDMEELKKWFDVDPKSDPEKGNFIFVPKPKAEDA